MFYSQVLLSRKGPLGKIWMAAHFDKKITRTQIFSTDISSSVHSILYPAQPLALRVSGHLMLGLVRIFNRKVKYLMSDCTEAMWKIKLAFKAPAADASRYEHPTAHVVDDSRYFGHVFHDTDFPELAGAAFSESQMQAARRSSKTVALEKDTTEVMLDDTVWFGAKGIDTARRATASRGASISIPRLSSVSETETESEVEQARLGEARSRGMSIGAAAGRPSFGRHSFGLISAAAPTLGYDEDYIPAFDEFGATDFGVPESEQALAYEPITLPSEFPSFETEMNPLNRSETQLLVGKPESPKKALLLRAFRKKRRVVVDATVELTTAQFKERFLDIASITRRLPIDHIIPYLPPDKMPPTAIQALSTPCGVRAMCSELQLLFQYTMTSGTLPFPKPKEEGQRRLVQHDVDHLPRIQEDEEMQPAEFFDDGYADVEMARGVSDEILSRRRSSISETGSLSSPRQRKSLSFEGRQSFQGMMGMTSVASDVERRGHDYFDEEYPFQQGSLEAVDFLGDTELPSGVVTGPLGLSRKVIDSMSAVPSETAFQPKLSMNVPTAGAILIRDRSSWSLRTISVMEILEAQLAKQSQISFHGLSSGISRRLAAGCFMEILQLKTWGCVEVAQERPFGDIYIFAVQ